MERENDQRIPSSRQSACVKHKRPSTDREFAVDLDRLKFTKARKSCCYGFPHAGGFPFVVPQLADRNALRLIPRNPKYGIEGPVRRLYMQFGVENNHGINYRVKDSLCVFPFVDRLLDACSKGRDIRECEHRAQNLAAIASGVGSYSKKKTSIAIAGFDPMWCSVRDHPLADSIEILHARKSVAQRTTEIRGLQAKHRHGSPVDAGNFVLAADYNYRNIDSIKHPDLVGGHPPQSRRVARHRAGYRELVILGHEISLSFNHSHDTACGSVAAHHRLQVEESDATPKAAPESAACETNRGSATKAGSQGHGTRPGPRRPEVLRTRLAQAESNLRRE